MEPHTSEEKRRRYNECSKHLRTTRYLQQRQCMSAKKRNSVNEVSATSNSTRPVTTQKSIPTMYVNFRDDLLWENETDLTNKTIKCPELAIKINNIDVIALLDLGSLVNGVSEEWFFKYKDQLGRYKMPSISNTFIISAIGKKSKHIKKQILCEIEINKTKKDCVFLIIPGLVRDCIIGMNFLQQEGCIINTPENYITLVTDKNKPKNGEQSKIIPLLTVKSQLGIKPKRSWEKFVDTCALSKDQMDPNKIYLRIKDKGRRQTMRLNKNHKITEFNVGDKVLITAYHTSDATQHINSKFCTLYEGPYIVTNKIGKAIYELNEWGGERKVSGIFNARQMKLYHSENST